MRKLLLLAALLCLPVFAQDCSFNISFTAAGNSAAHINDCPFLYFSYYSDGFSVVSVTLQGAPDNAGTPGTFVTLPGSVTIGSNPLTSTTGAYAAITATQTNLAAWLRVNLTVTGSGTITGRVYGYRNLAAGSGTAGGGGGGGCTAPCVVIGPDAPGAVSSQDPVQVAGNDGTDVRAIATDTSGRTEVVGGAAIGSPLVGAPVPIGNVDSSDNAIVPTYCNLSAPVSVTASGLTQIVALSAGKQIRVCNISVSFASGVDFQLETGTGSNCAGSTTALTGVYKTILTVALDFNSGTLNGTASQALCINLGSGVTGGGLVNYALY